MTRLPSLEEQDRRDQAERDAPPDALSHWSRIDRWTELGRQVAQLRDRAKREGVPIEALPGARGTIEAFKALGRELGRRGR